jgi:hypothetical protein
VEIGEGNIQDIWMAMHYIELLSSFTCLHAYSIPVTTDLQDVTICQVNTTTYIISCVFLSGSDASGCNYTLMSEEGSITGSIERSNSEGETIVVAGTAAGSELLLQAYASDLILDDTTGSLVIVSSITGLSVEPCPTGTTGLGT